MKYVPCSKGYSAYMSPGKEKEMSLRNTGLRIAKSPGRLIGNSVTVTLQGNRAEKEP